MNKKSLIILLLTFLLVSCNCSKKDTTFNEGDLLNTIYITSDIHLLSDKLVIKKEDKHNLVHDGRIQDYDYELVQALISEVNTNLPAALIITGDLTYNGEKKSHEALISLLDTIDKRVKVLVVPGNHDTHITNCIDYSQSDLTPTPTITNDEFKELYKNYGYDEKAIQLGNFTCNYIYPLSDKQWVVMIDSTTNYFNELEETNLVGGMIFSTTLSWLDEQLAYAKNNNIEIIAASHHNILTHNELFVDDYVMKKNADLMNLYEKYGVNLHFSGHLHIQSIQQNNKIYDIASSSILDYPNQYGILQIYENAYKYSTKEINVSDNIKEYSYNTFYEEYYNINVNGKMFGDYQAECVKLLSEINCYYFSGNYPKINELLNLKKNTEIASIIKSKAYGYSKSIIDVNNTDQRYLYIRKDL